MLGLLKKIYWSFFGYLARFQSYRRVRLAMYSGWEFVFPPTHNRLPIPTPKMRQLTTLNILGIKQHIDDGVQVAKEIESAICREGVDPKSLNAVLDFGCGPGRILRQLHHRWPLVNLFGSDVDQLAIDWSAKNLGEVAVFKANGYTPPLDFENSSLDAVYLISVFTHLDENVQLEWLREFHRVLKPDGLILMTIVRITEDDLTNRQWDFVKEEGFAFRYRQVEIVSRPWVTKKTKHPHYIDAKHTVSYCETAWADLFTFCHAEANVNGGTQTMVTLRKKG